MTLRTESVSVDRCRHQICSRTVSKIAVAMSLPHTLPVSFLLLSVFIAWSYAAAVTVTFDLLEESPPSTFVGNLSSESKIIGLFRYLPSVSTPLRYSFLAQDQTGHQRLFRLTEHDGHLSTREPVDREQLCPMEPDATCAIELNVAIRAGHLVHTVKVVVRVVDLNDHSPRFVKDRIQLMISEMALAGTEYPIPEAEDRDSGIFGIRDFVLLADDPPGTNGTFHLRMERTVDGMTELRLVLTRNLDREEVERYRMRVLARDAGNPVRTGTLLVDVDVQDVNDNTPRFVEPVLDVAIEENIANGTIIGVVKAVDRDTGSNGVVTFAFTLSTQRAVAGLFSIGSDSGEIRVTGLVDFERRRRYSLGIVASDGGSNHLSSHAVVTVHVTDVNDNAPRISVSPLTQSGTPEVRENAEVGTFVAHVSVTDPDTGSGGEWNCSLTGYPGFRLERIPEVNQNEFKLVTSTVFDREVAQLYNVTLTCVDHGLPALTSSAEVEIRILDENDEAPQFQFPVYSASVRENNKVGELVAKVTAFDRDFSVNGEISYAISRDENSGPAPVKIDAKLGLIYANVVFDREAKADYEFRVVASDAGQPIRSGSVNFRLNVTDVNDEPPRFINRMFTFGTYENQPRGTEIGTVTAVDFDGPPHNVIHYELVGSSMDMFQINSTTGRITSLKSLDREDVPVYLLNITATNPGTSLRGDTQVKVIVADRNDNPPRILFPFATNSTIQISSRVKIGDVIVTVEAVDDDVGSNAALRYVITGSEVAAGLFAVNLLTGVISVRRDLGNYADQSILLPLLVHDEGQPRKSASASLLITVNGTLEAASHSWGQRGPIPISTLTTIVSAAGASCVVVMVALVLFLILRRRSCGQDVGSGQQEVDKKLPLARGMRDEKYPDVKSNLCPYDEELKPHRNDKMLDRKNKNNSNKNKKNLNKNKKNSNKNEAGMQGKQIAWLATYEDNLLQTYNQKNNKIADSCCARSAPLPSNQKLHSPPPPPPPPAPSHPARYFRSSQEDGFGGQTGTPLPDQLLRSTAEARHATPCGCCGRQQHYFKQTPSQSPDGRNLVVPLIDRSSDQGSVTDSGRGQSEDGGELLTALNPNLHKACHSPFLGDHQLATYSINPRGHSVGWTTGPTCVSAKFRCEHTEHERLTSDRALQVQHRLILNRAATLQTDVTTPSKLYRLESRQPIENIITGSFPTGNAFNGSTIPSKSFIFGSTLGRNASAITGSVPTATGSAGQVTQNRRNEEEEDGHLSDDATTTSGSYVLENKDSNVWLEQQPDISEAASV